MIRVVGNDDVIVVFIVVVEGILVFDLLFFCLFVIRIVELGVFSVDICDVFFIIDISGKEFLGCCINM